MLVQPQALLTRCLRRVVSTAALAFLLAASPLGAEEQPQFLLPTRDVDITYRSTPLDQPTIVEHRRSSASTVSCAPRGPTNRQRSTTGTRTR